MEGTKAVTYRLADYDRWKTTEPDTTLPGDAPIDAPDEDEREAFLARWEEIRTPGGVYIARCKRCGFDAFCFSSVKIAKHDRTCHAQKEET